MLSKIAVMMRDSFLIRNNKKLRKALKITSKIIARVLYGRYKWVSIAKTYKYLLSSDFAFSNYENWGDRHNQGFKKLLNISKDKGVVFDIGAHIGLCSLPLSNIAKQIISFEASQINGNYLKRHLKINKINNVEIVSCLVGKDEKEDVSFYDVKGGSGIPSVVNLKALNKSVEVSNIKIKQISLDEFCSRYSIIPDVIKIDVEGAEFSVLDGSSMLLSAHRPDIIISLHPRHLKALKRDVKEIFNYCSKYSYQLLSCVDGHVITQNELSLDEYYMKPINSK
jgi:FkbM family methyltransferase